MPHFSCFSPKNPSISVVKNYEKVQIQCRKIIFKDILKMKYANIFNQICFKNVILSKCEKKKWNNNILKKLRVVKPSLRLKKLKVCRQTDMMTMQSVKYIIGRCTVYLFETSFDVNYLQNHRVNTLQIVVPIFSFVHILICKSILISLV
jgi:hypothetical protein